jgi:predicted nucleic acid-binding protein
VRRAYFDASAITKLVHEERESLALVDFLVEPMDVVTSAISEVEVVRALRRYRIAPEEVADALRGFVVVAIDAEIRAQAAALDPPTVRSLDAIHLATAMALGADGLDVVTYDDRLADAADAHGFTVVQPGRPARKAARGKSRRPARKKMTPRGPERSEGAEAP